jgi:hypothetical protein
MVAYVRGLRDYDDAIVRNKDQEAVLQILQKYSSIKDRAVYDRMTTGLIYGTVAGCSAPEQSHMLAVAGHGSLSPKS